MMELAESKPESFLCTSEKKGARTAPGAQTKECTALKSLIGVGSARASSINSDSRCNSMFHLLCTAGVHEDGLPHGIRRAALITLQREAEIASWQFSEERRKGGRVRSGRKKGEQGIVG